MEEFRWLGTRVGDLRCCEEFQILGGHSEVGLDMGEVLVYPWGESVLP